MILVASGASGKFFGQKIRAHHADWIQSAEVDALFRIQLKCMCFAISLRALSAARKICPRGKLRASKLAHRDCKLSIFTHAVIERGFNSDENNVVF